MTAANAPWQNGVVGRNHATADIIVEKLILDDPNIPIQEAINQASFAKNSEVNKTGYSALQLVNGRNATYPGLDEQTTTSSNFDNANRYMKLLKNIDKSRVLYRQIECDEKLKKLRSQRINPAVERFYKIGDHVVFRDEKKKEWKKAQYW